jgi:hypothetical protein
VLDENNVWLSQKRMAELFDVAENNITYHLKNIFNEKELNKEAVTQKIRVTANDGKSYYTGFYNLEVIVAVGYRVNSQRAIDFRKWATEVLKEYMVKGFAMNDEKLKKLGGGSYWKELLERIRDIRSSEKVFYRQILDIYSTSIDYNAKDITSVEFFKTVQNKIHYAVHGNTAKNY